MTKEREPTIEVRKNDGAYLRVGNWEHCLFRFAATISIHENKDPWCDIPPPWFPERPQCTPLNRWEWAEVLELLCAHFPMMEQLWRSEKCAPWRRTMRLHPVYGDLVAAVGLTGRLLRHGRDYRNWTSTEHRSEGTAPQFTGLLLRCPAALLFKDFSSEGCHYHVFLYLLGAELKTFSVHFPDSYKGVFTVSRAQPEWARTVAAPVPETWPEDVSERVWMSTVQAAFEDSGIWGLEQMKHWIEQRIQLMRKLESLADGTATEA